MSRFKKNNKKGMGAISTASLPDIVFMLLFFFMVTTVMRETTLFVEVVTPKATEIKKMEKNPWLAIFILDHQSNDCSHRMVHLPEYNLMMHLQA